MVVSTLLYALSLGSGAIDNYTKRVFKYPVWAGDGELSRLARISGDEITSSPAKVTLLKTGDVLVTEGDYRFIISRFCSDLEQLWLFRECLQLFNSRGELKPIRAGEFSESALAYIARRIDEEAPTLEISPKTEFYLQAGVHCVLRSKSHRLEFVQRDSAFPEKKDREEFEQYFQRNGLTRKATSVPKNITVTSRLEVCSFVGRVKGKERIAIEAKSQQAFQEWLDSETNALSVKLGENAAKLRDWTKYTISMGSKSFSELSERSPAAASVYEAVASNNFASFGFKSSVDALEQLKVMSLNQAFSLTLVVRAKDDKYKSVSIRLSSL